MAIASSKVTADTIEAEEFPDWVQSYRVSAVPHTVINDRVSVIGAVSEARFLTEIQRALASPSS